MSDFVDSYLEFMKFLDDIVRKALIVITGLMTLTVILQVLFRYILKNPLVWTEELARYLMIWMAFIGASCVIKKWENIYVDFFINMLKQKTRYIAYFIQKIIVLATLSFIFYLCLKVIPEVAGNQTTAAMGINMMWAQSAIIFGLLLMVLQNIGVILNDLFKVKIFEGGKKI